MISQFQTAKDRARDFFAVSVLAIALCFDTSATEGEAPPAFQVGPPITIASQGSHAVAARNSNGIWHVGYFASDVLHTARATDPAGPWVNVATVTTLSEYWWWNPQIVSLGEDRWYQEITVFDAYNCQEYEEGEGEGEYWKGSVALQSVGEKCSFSGDNYGLSGFSEDDGITWNMTDYSGFSYFAFDNYDIAEVFILQHRGKLFGILQYDWSNELLVAWNGDNWINWNFWSQTNRLSLDELNTSGYLLAVDSNGMQLACLIAGPVPQEGGTNGLALNFLQSSNDGETWGSLPIISPETPTEQATNLKYREDFNAQLASGTAGRYSAVWIDRDLEQNKPAGYVSSSFDNGASWLTPHLFTNDAMSWMQVEYFDLNGLIILWRESPQPGANVWDMPIRYAISYDNGQNWTAPQELDEGFNRYGVIETPTLVFDGQASGHMVYSHKTCVDCPHEVVIVPVTIAPDPDPAVVTEEDASRALLEDYRILDNSDDGRLSEEEATFFLRNIFPIHLRSEAAASELFARMDSNSDGVITVAEVRWIGVVHAADLEARGAIDMSNLLRVIQLFNADEYHCNAVPGDTEDGYDLGPGPQDCPPHSSDYNPQDWRLSLSELLRLVQFFNSGTYHPCDNGEDGYCPGAALQR
jgi:hypothetical protein